MRWLRNVVIQLSITHIVLLVITILPGIRFRDELAAAWIASLVFVLLTALLRPVLLALTLPLSIMTAGLFIFVIDGVLLLLTGLITGLEIAGFGWAVLGGITMGVTNIWVQSAFKRMGWMEREHERDPAEIKSPGLLLRILLVVGLLFGISFGASTAGRVALTLSRTTSSLPILAGAGLATLIAATLFVAWLVAEGLEMRRRARFSAIVTVLTTGVAAITVGLLLLPVDAAVTLPFPDPEVAYWELPTGSRIAYVRLGAVGTSHGVPVVYLHDGPGLAVLAEDRAFYGRLAESGFDVYLYDQVGTGLSDRLDNIAEYGIERDIADLDAIRRTLDSHRLILIGHGAGAELAVRYLGRYPERVEKAVLHSPTPLWDDEQFFNDYVRTASPIGPTPVLIPRLALAAALATYGPGAAEKLVSQEEMSIWLDRAYSPRTLVCARDSERAPRATGAGFNYYVNIRTGLSSREPPDPRPRIEDNLTPTIILASECGYIPWEVVLQYEDALLDDKVFYFEGAGHAIHLTQPEPAAGVIRAFLLGQDYPIAPYRQAADPRPALPR